MLKTLLGNPIIQTVIGRTLGLYMRLVGATTRWRMVNRSAVEHFWAQPQMRLIGCVWHGRFALAHKLWRFGAGAQKAYMLVSRSREGDIVALAARTVGVKIVRGSAAKGSQQKGGAAATLELIRQIDAGALVALTPDGPRGPRMRAKLGPVQIAKMAQAPMLSLAWSTSSRIVLSSWDRCVMPLPFGRGVLVWGDPIPPPSPDADVAEMERVRARLETELNRITAEADRLAGAEAIEPAAAPAPEAAAS